MSRYIVQLRRGTKEQWETTGEDIVPLEGEVVLEYDNGVPRLKIGDGIKKYGELPYMSVDSFIMPKPIYIRLKKNDWTQDVSDNRWYQDVKVAKATITPNSKIDLQPSPELLCVFHAKSLAFVAENDGGNVRVYCVGQVPLDENDPDGFYDIQATVTEVATNG